MYPRLVGLPCILRVKEFAYFVLMLLGRHLALETGALCRTGALREIEDQRVHVKRRTLPEAMHLPRFSQLILCNPTCLGDNKMCAVAFPSKQMLC
jgi:hypothetical protein